MSVDGSSVAPEEQPERDMPAEEAAWLTVAWDALFKAQQAAGNAALAADDLALLHRYQAAWTTVGDLTRVTGVTFACGSCGQAIDRVHPDARWWHVATNEERCANGQACASAPRSEP